MRVKFQSQMVVGYWELVSMESGADNSSDKYTATVTKQLEEPAEKRSMTLWWKEENWTRLKRYMDIWRNPEASVVCDADCLGLGKDPVP